MKHALDLPVRGAAPFAEKIPFSSSEIVSQSMCSTSQRNTAVSPNLMKPQLVSMLPRLRRFARSLTGSMPDADDLVQDACLRAISKSHQWDPTQPLDRWMFRIIRNIWISDLRKRSVRVGQGTVAADETSELVVAGTSEDAVLAQDLQRQIDNLPDELSTLLLTVSVEGYSYAEAAELFDIPLGTVMSRIHRARKLLAAQIAPESRSQ